MGGFLKKFGVFALSVMMLGSVAGSALAAAGNGVNYTAQAGTNVSFNKYLVMSAGDKTPAATFNYTIASGRAIPASSGKMAVLAGVGSPTVSASVFTSDQSTFTSATSAQIDVQRTDRTNVKWEASVGEKFAVSTSTVDFSGVSFAEPGIYRYIITETASVDDTAKGIIHDDDVDRVLDVYVTDDGSGNLVVSQYVLHKDDDDVSAGADMGSGDVASAGAPLDDKTDGFTNEYKSKDLVFKKEVTGNQASRDKFFEFTLQVTGLADGDKYVVSIANDNDANTTDGNALATSGSNEATIGENAGKTNPTEVTGAQLAAGVKYYLTHGQFVAVRGLPISATYTVTENAEDYKSTASVVEGYTAATTGVIGTVAGENKVVKTSYLNTRDGIIPTGVIMTVAPYVAILVIGLGAVAFFVLNKKKKENSSED